ncbi:unnamed protein product [Eruca vesicaria subsp. sativa]|uniref:Uncharacterized protein n=1 Tax=Eruca vesicaria subsp. sativa TaxID=29727 RepID=A0ABC8JSV0_ERUVS|nr:unnamed protein product [Eruca vesicaria subsp. sativa]
MHKRRGDWRMLITTSTDLRWSSDEIERISSGGTRRNVRLSVVRLWCKIRWLLVVRGRWLKLCEGGDGG